MKIRKCYVSNSSSSSFVCEVCGNIESGWDASFSDVYMTICSAGHVFCRHHVLDDPDACAAVYAEITEQIKEGNDKLLQYLEADWPTYKEDLGKAAAEGAEFRDVTPTEEIYDEINDYLYDHPGESVPRSCCPICQFNEIQDRDIDRYIYKLIDKSRTQIIDEIKSRFNSYKQFQEYLNEDQN